jgi:hypothetical protein
MNCSWGKEPDLRIKSLVAPVNAFVEMLERRGVKVAVFVDAAYLFRLKELSQKDSLCQRDLDLVRNHIAHIQNRGHDVQLHFHPQWLYSDRKEGVWSLDFAHYKLSDMEKNFCFDRFSASKSILDDALGEKTTAFRAGGYSLSSCTFFPELFRKNGIQIDSSVLRHGHVRSTFHTYDYRNPPGKTIYRFSDSLTTENPYGEFLELSITRYRLSLRDYILRKKGNTNENFSPTWGDGVGIGYPGGYLGRLWRKYSKVFKPTRLGGVLDSVLSTSLEDIFDLHCKKNPTEAFVAVGHPKSFSLNSIRAVEKFISRIQPTVHFKTCKDLIP